MYCPNCGAECADTVKFCTKCGTPMQVQQPVEQPAYAQPVQQPMYAQQPIYAQPVNTQPQAPVQSTVASEEGAKKLRFCGAAILALLIILIKLMGFHPMRGADSFGTYLVFFGLLALSVTCFIRRKVPIAVPCFIIGVGELIRTIAFLARWSSYLGSMGSYPFTAGMNMRTYFFVHLMQILVTATGFLLLGAYALFGFNKKKTGGLVGLFAFFGVVDIVYALWMMGIRQLFRSIYVYGTRGFQMFWMYIQSSSMNFFSYIAILLIGILIIGLASWIASPYSELNDRGFDFKYVDRQRFSVGGHVVLLLFLSEIYYFIWTCRATSAGNGVMNRANRAPVLYIFLRMLPLVSIFWYANTAKRLQALGEARGVRFGIASIVVWSIFCPFIAAIITQTRINQVAEAGMHS